MLNSSAVMLKSQAIIVNKFSENGKLIIQTKNHSYGCTTQWTAVVNSICAAFTESRMAARHKGYASAPGNQTNFTAVCRLRRLRRRVGSTCLAGWRRHVLLWVLLLRSVLVVVADIGSDVERLVCAPRLWLIARRNCSLLYDPLSY